MPEYFHMDQKRIKLTTLKNPYYFPYHRIKKRLIRKRFKTIRRPKAPHNTTQYITHSRKLFPPEELESEVSLCSMIGKLIEIKVGLVSVEEVEKRESTLHKLERIVFND